MLRHKAGINQRVNGGHEGTFDPSDGSSELVVISVVLVVEQTKGGGVADHQPEVGPKGKLDLLARARGLRGGLGKVDEHLIGEGVDKLEIEGPLR